ncbi:oligosaccharide flippase family protein [Amnibacterium kyonggiense]
MAEASLKRAVTLMTLSSALVPVVGVLSAPIITHALGVNGRGALSVASAPNVLLAGVVTFGLPEAITFYTAKFPALWARAVLWSTALIIPLCGLGIVAVYMLTPFLTNHDAAIGPLVLIGSFLAIPLLLLSLVRGAATGLQMWGAVAFDRVLSGVFRLVLVVVLFASDHLTVLTALLATTAGPLIGVLAYGRLLAAARSAIASGTGQPVPPISTVFRYGLHTWFGAVAGILLSRINQVLFAPLSTVDQLGLYVVAVTISDVPLITAIAIRDALFGVNSKRSDAAQLAVTTRTTIFIGLLGTIAIAVSLPLWIGRIFGTEFVAAVPTTQILLLSSLANIPAFLAAAGLAAWGRPGLRSTGLVVTLAVGVVLFLILVPPFGAVGAAWSAFISSVVSAAWMTAFAARVLHVSIRDLLIVRRSDLVLLWTQVRRRIGPPSRAARRAG